MESILIFRIGHLGDTIVALPAISAIRQQFPHARLTLLCNRRHGKTLILASDLLRGTGIFERFESYDMGDSKLGGVLRAAGMAGLLFKLRRQRFDALVYLAPSMRTPAQVRRDRRFFALAGIKRFYGLQGFRPLPRKIPGQPLGATPPEADLLLERLAADGLPVPGPGEGCLDMGLGEEEEGEVQSWQNRLPGDGGRTWVGIGPGSKMPAKRWPEDRFGEVVRELILRQDIWPVVFGGAEDAAIGQRLLATWGRGYNAAGVLSLRGAAAALRRCRFYLGNDTGTMHLAATARTPCVAIFSARDWPGMWSPYGVEKRVFRAHIDCEGCGLVECTEKLNECIKRISAVDVLTACQEFFPSPGGVSELGVTSETP